MGQRGTHTWDLVYLYHCCPKCGLIIESREDFHYRLGHYEKDLECPRCGQSFTLRKTGEMRIGPFFGDPPKPEMEWGK